MNIKSLNKVLKVKGVVVFVVKILNEKSEEIETDIVKDSVEALKFLSKDRVEKNLYFTIVGIDESGKDIININKESLNDIVDINTVQSIPSKDKEEDTSSDAKKTSKRNKYIKYYIQVLNAVGDTISSREKYTFTGYWEALSCFKSGKKNPEFIDGYKFRLIGVSPENKESVIFEEYRTVSKGIVDDITENKEEDNNLLSANEDVALLKGIRVVEFRGRKPIFSNYWLEADSIRDYKVIKEDYKFTSIEKAYDDLMIFSEKYFKADIFKLMGRTVTGREKEILIKKFEEYERKLIEYKHNIKNNGNNEEKKNDINILTNNKLDIIEKAPSATKKIENEINTVAKDILDDNKFNASNEFDFIKILLNSAEDICNNIQIFLESNHNMTRVADKDINISQHALESVDNNDVEKLLAISRELKSKLENRRKLDNDIIKASILSKHLNNYVSEIDKMNKNQDLAKQYYADSNKVKIRSYRYTNEVEKENILSRLYKDKKTDKRLTFVRNDMDKEIHVYRHSSSLNPYKTNYYKK